MQLLHSDDDITSR